MCTVTIYDCAQSDTPKPFDPLTTWSQLHLYCLIKIGHFKFLTRIIAHNSNE
jgi:hypothetical protein